MIRVWLHLLALHSYHMGSGRMHRCMDQQLCGLARVWEVSYGGISLLLPSLTMPGSLGGPALLQT